MWGARDILKVTRMLYIVQMLLVCIPFYSVLYGAEEKKKSSFFSSLAATFSYIGQQACDYWYITQALVNGSLILLHRYCQKKQRDKKNRLKSSNVVSSQRAEGLITIKMQAPVDSEKSISLLQRGQENGCLYHPVRPLHECTHATALYTHEAEQYATLILQYNNAFGVISFGLTDERTFVLAFMPLQHDNAYKGNHQDLYIRLLLAMCTDLQVLCVEI